MEKNKHQNMGRYLATRRFKYGAVATIFTVVFIAAVILLNVIVSAIDAKYKLYVDLTHNQIFTIRYSTRESVRQQLDEYWEWYQEDYKNANGREFDGEFKITFSFLKARDQLLANQQSNWVVTLAESYAEAFPEIQIVYKEDLFSHPERYSEYIKLGYTINSDTIIVSSSLQKENTPITNTVFSLDSCLVYDEEGEYVWAFKGEIEFNSAIQALTARKHYVAAFTTKHGETKPKSLVEYLETSGFEVKDIDLTKEDISEDVRLLVICNPTTDFNALEDVLLVSEYTRLSNYLSNFGSVLFIASPTMPKLPVLDELLEERGMVIERNQTVMDDISSVSGDNRMLIAEYPESTTVAKGITGSLTDLSNPPMSVSWITAPITIVDPGDGSNMGVEAVLTSSVNAYVEETTDDGVVKKKGPFNLMAVSTIHDIQNNENVYGHLVVIGSEYFSELNAYESQYGNTRIMYNMIRLMSNENLPQGTDYKVLEDYGITVKAGDVYVYGIITVIVIPLIIFGLGIAVYLKRKHL